ncbi:MAG: alkaline phosphatase, partial [Pyrinomonadaceae bacterium]
MREQQVMSSVVIVFATLVVTLFGNNRDNGVAAAKSKSGPVVRIVLPERFRVLSHQLFDLRVEVSGLTSPTAQLQITVNNGNRRDALIGLEKPEVTMDNDADPKTLDKAWTYRNVSFDRDGIRTIQAIISDGRSIYRAATQTSVQEFRLTDQKSIILFIGDAMGTAYRDAGRIVAQSTNNRFREGFFDELLQMDRMPVTGMVMTYALDQITPDSANTATAWASGNKTVDGALNVFPDNNDFRFDRTSTATQQATRQYALDNPRVETLWEYLKRRHGYKTGIVTTADVTDATPAGEGGHTISRSLQNDIARQYVDGVFTSAPT